MECGVSLSGEVSAAEAARDRAVMGASKSVEYHRVRLEKVSSEKLALEQALAEANRQASRRECHLKWVEDRAAESKEALNLATARANKLTEDHVGAASTLSTRF